MCQSAVSLIMFARSRRFVFSKYDVGARVALLRRHGAEFNSAIQQVQECNF